MASAGPTSDYFETARRRAADLPARLSIEQRLATLAAELSARGVSLQDERVPRLIHSLFPPGTIEQLGGPGKDDASVPAARDRRTRRRSSPQPPKRTFGPRRLLTASGAALLLVLAADRYPIAEAPPPVCPSSDISQECGEGGGPTGTETIIESAEVETYNPRFFQLLAANFLGWGIAWYALRLRRRKLVRDSNPDMAPTLDIAVRLGRAQLFSTERFDGIVKQLRLRRLTPSQRLDVGKSLRATIGQAGFPAIRFGEQRVRPEYLLLSDRQMAGDHLPELNRALHARMAAGQVDVHHYEFQGTPFRLRHDHASHRRGFEPLESVMSRHPGSRVLIATESFDIASDARRSNADWIDTIAQWQRPILLNPRSEDHWHYDEDIMSASGFVGLSAGGLDARSVTVALADRAAPTSEKKTAESPGADLPVFLAQERDLLLSNHPPDDEQIEALVHNLSFHWLDRDEMVWLRTLALFPTVHVGFTYFAAMALRGNDDIPAASFLKIARLPWFRAGQTPEWLRVALVHGLSDAEFEIAKATVQAFFEPESRDARAAEDILKVRERASRPTRRRAFLKRMRRSSIPALQDRLLVNAFQSRSPESIDPAVAVKVSRPWYLRPWVQTMTAALLGLVMLEQLIGYKHIISVDVEIPKDIKETIDTPQVPTPDAGKAGEKMIDTPAVVVPGDETPEEVGPAGRTIYVQIANEADRQAALAIMGRLRALQFPNGPAIVGGPELVDRPLSQTIIRCFNKSACANSETLRSALEKEISARITIERIQPWRGEPLEVWFADKDLQDEESVPPSICGGPFIVFFDWDSSAISPEAAAVLDNAIDAYNKNCRGSVVSLAASTDRSSNEKYSIGLSERYNTSIRNYLASRGIPERNIQSFAYGSARLAVKTADGVREPQNRRVEIIFSYPPAASD